MRVAAVLILVAAGAAAGCLGPMDAECPARPPFATPVVDGKYMQTDPAQAWQTVVLAPPDDGGRTTELAWNTSRGWLAHGTDLSAPGEGRLQVATVTPGDGKGEARLDYAVRTDLPSCRNTQRGSLHWDLAVPERGEGALPGQGVHVMTAGFFENGTLFYTNIPEVDTDPNWPRVSWYKWEGDQPLPVYVYDRDRGEQPQAWKSASSAVAQVPKTGSPADGELAKRAQEADEEFGLGYFTTIPGFNEALKGLSTTTTRVVRLAPEEAYTRPGNEGHDLYGHPIVFYIKVLDVVSSPCPAETPPMLCQAGAPAQR